MIYSYLYGILNHHCYIFIALLILKYNITNKEYNFGCIALEKKLGLESSSELASEEKHTSKKKTLGLFKNGILAGLEAEKFSMLKTIHKYLFDEIYT